MTTTAEKLAILDSIDAHLAQAGADSAQMRAAVLAEAGQQPDTTPPVIPGSIIVSALAPTGYTLTWSAGSDNVGVDAYEFSLDGGASWTPAGLALTVDVTGRTPSTTDQVQVRAKDAAGNISTTLLVAVNLPPVPDTTPPVMQGPIIVTGLTPQGYSLAWPVATDNVGVLRYDISLDDGATWADIGLVQSYSATSRTPGTTDHVRLRALDQAGNISIPLTLDVVLPNLPPPSPADSIVFSQIAVGTVHPLGGSNRRCVVSLHGGGESNLSGMQGDVYKGVRSGKFIPQYTGHLDCFFEARNDSTGLAVALLPQNYNLTASGVNVRDFWCGHIDGPGTALDRASVRWVIELIRQAPTLFPQIDPRKICLSGNSMGAWGAAKLLSLLSDKLAYASLDMPVWRRFGSTADVFQVCSLKGSPLNQEQAFSGSLQLSAIDGGGLASAYYDMIAYVSNAANVLCPVVSNITTGDGYGNWLDVVLMRQAMLATKRWHKLAWGPGIHGTRPPYPADLLAGQDLDEFLLGRGLPLFTNCSRDANPAVDASGAINPGMCFRGVVETPTSFTCQVRNVLAGSTTVTVEPCMSTVFNPGGQAVQPQTVTLAQNVWQTLSWSA